MQQTHTAALQQKHAGIDRQIGEELSRPAPDPIALQALKKRKLAIKQALGG